MGCLGSIDALVTHQGPHRIKALAHKNIYIKNAFSIGVICLTQCNPPLNWITHPHRITFHVPVYSWFQIQHACGVEYRRFDFTLYPKHVKILTNYAFKFMIIMVGYQFRKYHKTHKMLCVDNHWVSLTNTVQKFFFTLTWDHF